MRQRKTQHVTAWKFCIKKKGSVLVNLSCVWIFKEQALSKMLGLRGIRRKKKRGKKKLETIFWRSLDFVLFV